MPPRDNNSYALCLPQHLVRHRHLRMGGTERWKKRAREGARSRRKKRAVGAVAGGDSIRFFLCFSLLAAVVVNFDLDLRPRFSPVVPAPPLNGRATAMLSVEQEAAAAVM